MALFFSGKLHVHDLVFRLFNHFETNPNEIIIINAKRAGTTLNHFGKERSEEPLFFTGRDAVFARAEASPGKLIEECHPTTFLCLQCESVRGQFPQY